MRKGSRSRALWSESRESMAQQPFYKQNKWKDKRKSILRRDEYLCRECKRYGRSRTAQTVHHINPLEDYPELALVSDNLLSLCNSCHDTMHDRITRVLTEAGERWREKVALLLKVDN